MKSRAVRMIEVALLRAIAREEFSYVVDAENTAPGEGIMFLWLKDGSKVKLQISLVAERA